MKYPKEFLRQLRDLYPNSPSLLLLIDTEQDLTLGRQLWDMSEKSFDYEEILNAKSLGELKAEAELIRQKRMLYNEWDKINKYSEKWTKQTS